MRTDDFIKQPLSTVQDGRTWHLYSVDFTTADGRFGTYIYALSDEHAVAIVEELKATATLAGRLGGVVHCEKD